jgi:uncharacterized protein with FMN-binding domain
MHRGLVALSASAVAAIYMAGYLRTQSADASIGAASLPTSVATSAPVAAVAPAATATSAPPAVVQVTAPRTAPTLQPTPQATTSSAAAAATQTAPPSGATQPPPTSGTGQAVATGYKDGTYTGQGSSRRGDVWVSIQIQAGRIANVTITRSTLQYPLRDIANLPSQVVQRQTALVDVVSRATYSSMAFRGAVSQALTSATAG